MPPWVCNFDARPIPQCRAERSPSRRPNTPPQIRADGSAWLNTLINYDTNKSTASPVPDAVPNGRLYVSQQLPGCNTNSIRDLEFCGRNRHLQTTAGRSFRSEEHTSE